MKDVQATVNGQDTSSAKAKMESVTLKKAKGGWSIEHNFDNSGGPGYRKPEQHVFAKGSEFLAHVAKVMGVPGASEEKGEKEHEG